MAHSVLEIPVPDLDPVVRPRLERRSPAEVPADPHDTVAHISLLGPFVALTDLTEGVLDELTRFFSDVTSFGYVLTGVHVSPGGTAYVAPNPAAPFRHLAHELSRLFPEHASSGPAGLLDAVPHVTVPLLDGEDADALEHLLGPRFPLSTVAREAALYWWEPGACRTLATFPFGTSAA